LNRPVKNIGFVSSRISGIDGVSHEIEKWASILERNGYSCFYCAGEIDREPGSSFILEEAHFQHPEIVRINRSVFGRTTRSGDITALIHRIAGRIRDGLDRFIRTLEIDCIIAENSLSIPMNIPLGVALTELIVETGIPTIAHHHDFAWERERYLVNAAGDFIQMSFPPAFPTIEHVVINSLAQASLSLRRGVSSTVIPNTFDFTHHFKPAAGDLISSLRRDAGIDGDELFILQPTRVVPRKCIERSVDLVALLSGAGGRLVISHPTGDEGEEYYRKLNDYADMKKVELRFIDRLVSPGRSASKERPYTIGDVYQAADLITYPSAYEGFGNAFLESIYFRKPLVVNRYPVFIADIEIHGFDVIRIDGFVDRDTVRSVEKILADGDLRERTAEVNYRTALAHFSFARLENTLLSVMRRLTPQSPS
jgi:glycosyltransferase involved in cell wall biosynthesis